MEKVKIVQVDRKVNETDANDDGDDDATPHFTACVNGIHPAPDIHEHFMIYKGYGTLRISSRTTSTILNAL